MLLVLLLMGLVVYFIIKSEKAKPNTRWPATVFLLLFTVVITQWNDPIRVFLKKEKLLIKKNTNLVVRFTRNGYLNFFMQALFLQTKLAEPHGYSPQRLQSIKQKHNLGIPGVARYQQPSPDNIIVILAESFVDPNELGWQTSEPVLKEFNDMRADYLSGHVVVPVYGGKSINTEFELLTGLTTYFTPIESLPFRELVSDNTPSIAHTLKPFGFHTSVIQMVQLSGFGFERIYDYLGFDNKYSLVDPTDPKDPTGRHVSSKTLAMKINAITAVEEKSFIYTFANSSHMPWELSDYPDNKLKLTNPGTLSQSKQDELVAYFNALRHVESLLVELVAFYQASDEKTLIVLVGDHHPSLQLVDRQKKVFKTHENYVVPFLLWQNYDSKSPSENPVFLSMNFLSSLVLKAAHVESTGFFKFNAILMEQLKVVSARYPFVSGLTEEQKILLDEYQVMQYHILMD
jgi:phosphoglycerol transferase MdoB-like AlkP superfamily enzyme